MIFGNSQIKQKKLSCLVCIARAEERFAEEWFWYHIAIGFDHIFIYDNSRDNDIKLKSVMPANNNKLTILNFPGESKQHAAYTDFMENYSNDYEWAAFIDLDEFIIFRTHQNVQGFLAEFGHLKSIGMQWLMFGHSGHKIRPSGLVLEDFVWRYPVPFSQVKSFCRCSEINSVLSIHNINKKCRLVNGFDLLGRDHVELIIDDIRYHGNLDATDIVCINHYFTRSLEDLAIKTKRGSAAGTISRKF